MSNSPSFTRRQRRRTTKWIVRLNDRLAHLVIAVGGIGTIVAVSLVALFLIWVVVPLFLPAAVDRGNSAAVASPADNVLAMGIDENNWTSWAIIKGGGVEVIRLDTGDVIQRLSADQSGLAGATAVSQGIGEPSIAVGLKDGHARLGTVAYDSQVVSAEDVPENARDLALGNAITLDDGKLLIRGANGEFRRQEFKLSLQQPIDLGIRSAIIRIDHVTFSGGSRLCTLAADGSARVHEVTSTTNIATGEEEFEVTSAELSMSKRSAGPPDYLLISQRGDAVFAAWRDGWLARFKTRRIDQLELMEQLDLVPEAGHSLSAMKFLLGRTTLVAGDTLGRVRGWFTAPIENTDTAADEIVPKDQQKLVPAHEFAAEAHAVSAIGPSPRSRLVVAGFADGTVRLLQLAAQRILAEMKCPEGGAVAAAAISPKGNLILTTSGSALTRWNFDARHPDASLATLFQPVWYEGLSGPAHVWQTTGSSDASEPKFGLMPLVFGTLKATFYTMLFGAPLALLAAIYSSEFLNPRLRARIKPTIEMMASLPSVVLGFLAGMVLAPFAERVIPQVITCVFTTPLAFVAGAYVWQLLPVKAAVRLTRYRLIFIFGLLPLGILCGFWLGPIFESLLFEGNLKQWLNTQRGSAVGAWIVLLLPISSVFIAAVFARQINPWLRRRSLGWSRSLAGLADLAKFLAGIACSVAIAAAIAWALDGLKLDPRGSIVGTYVQRNALVVGFAMGFAIIPLIYTIADDALSTVPEHLRSASLGAGATPWQTAIRIVVPTAASGLFSAVVIGLGRAVGETMIVLMAAGNMPIFDINIFTGFETLSMAIATELPEAPKYSTHYRVLFLAALTLFVMTFFLNTVAEVVRQRFRRRAYEL